MVDEAKLTELEGKRFHQAPSPRSRRRRHSRFIQGQQVRPRPSQAPQRLGLVRLSRPLRGRGRCLMESRRGEEGRKEGERRKEGREEGRKSR